MSEADALEDWSDEGMYEDDWMINDDYDRSYFKPKKQVKQRAPKSACVAQRGAKVEMLCNCGSKYKARKADLLRGWGLSCSKSCAAKRREFSLPSAKILGEV